MWYFGGIVNHVQITQVLGIYLYVTAAFLGVLKIFPMNMKVIDIFLSTALML